MIKRVPNPYKEDWSNFDIEEFKDDIGHLIDELALAETREERDVMVNTIDDHLIYFSILLVYKDEDEIDVIRIEDIPKDQLEQAGLSPEDFGFNGSEYMPIKQIEELFDIKIRTDTGWRI